MATYYWVGGSGTWTATSTGNWAASSGGAPGAGPPTSADAILFDANSGTGTITLGSDVVASYCYANTAANLVFVSNGYKLTLAGNNNLLLITSATVTSSDGMLLEATYSGAVGTRQFVLAASGENSSFSVSVTAGTDTLTVGPFVKNLTLTGFAGTLTNAARRVYGDLTLGAGMTLAAGAQITTFTSTSGTKTIRSNGKTMDFPLVFDGVGGSWVLADALTGGASRSVTLTNGSFNANGYAVSLGSFALGSGTKTLTLGSGTWAVAGNWDANTNVANLTVSASTGTINMTSASSKTFAGGAKTWPTLNQGGAGALTVQQSNTFTNITNTVQPATITFTAGTTQTVTDFDVSGTAGNLITLNSSVSGSRATLTDSGGVNSVSYVSIKDIAATGYGEWQAYTSNGNVDNGNNVGWVFAEPPPLTASEYQISFKSFTERRSF